MRYLSLPIGNDLLEIHNNMWTGHETIYFNGEAVSRRFSFFGCEHFFTAENELGQTDRYVVKISFSWLGVVFDVFRNDVCLLASGKTALSRVRGGGCRNRYTRPASDNPLDEEFLV